MTSLFFKIVFIFIALILQISLLSSIDWLKFLSLFSMLAIFLATLKKDFWITFTVLIGGFFYESLSHYPFGFLILAIFLTIWFSRASLEHVFTHRSWLSLGLFSMLTAFFYGAIIFIGDVLFGVRPLLMNNLLNKLFLGTVLDAAFLLSLLILNTRNASFISYVRK